MLSIRNLFLLLLCMAMASPVWANLTADPEEFALEDIPTGVVFDQGLTLSNNSNNQVSFSIGIELVDQNDLLGPERDRRGGPDDMGYEWRDNLEEMVPNTNGSMFATGTASAYITWVTTRTPAGLTSAGPSPSGIANTIQCFATLTAGCLSLTAVGISG